MADKLIDQVKTLLTTENKMDVAEYLQAITNYARYEADAEADPSMDYATLISDSDTLATGIGTSLNI
jgi:hypothetical protein